MIACFCNYDPPSVYVVKTHTARKQHECYECSRAIQPGEKYENVFGVWDGVPGTYKTCFRCLEIRRFVTASVPCFCWAHGNLHEDAYDTAEEYAHEADGLLFGTMRRIVISRRAIKQETKP